MIRLVIDCKTGNVVARDLTALEIAAVATRRAAAVDARNARVAKEQAEAAARVAFNTLDPKTATVEDLVAYLKAVPTSRTAVSQ